MVDHPRITIIKEEEDVMDVMGSGGKERMGERDRGCYFSYSYTFIHKNAPIVLCALH